MIRKFTIGDKATVNPISRNEHTVAVRNSRRTVHWPEEISHLVANFDVLGPPEYIAEVVGEVIERWE